MKLKKEIIVLSVLFIFSLGYYFGLDASEKSIYKKVEENKNIYLDKNEELYDVLEVIDGDTIKINYKGKKKSVRILGMNTPEKKNPFRPQECFGEEASKKAKEILKNKKVRIEFDGSQSKYDKFGRILAYIILDDGRDFEYEMIKNGYAYEYTYHGRKYKNQKKYKEAQKYAEKNHLGLWSKNTCNGER